MISVRLTLIVVLSICWLGAAQDDTKDRFAFVPPEFQLVIEDRFEEDPKTHFTLVGNASWQPGKVMLGESSSLGNKLLTDWTRLEFDFEKPPGNHRLELSLDFESKSFQLRLALDSELGTAKIELVEVPSPDEFAIEKTVRQQELDPTMLVSDFVVECRFGLIRVSSGSNLLLCGYTDAYDQSLQSWKLQSSQGQFSVKRIKVVAAPLQDDESNPLLEQANKLNQSMTRAVRRGDFNDAIEDAKECREIFDSQLGTFRKEYLVVMHNLVSAYKKVRDTENVVKLYQQILSVEKALLGGRHPEYATSLRSFAKSIEPTGQSDQVERLYRKAVEIHRSSLGVENIEYNVSLFRLGLLLSRFRSIR